MVQESIAVIVARFQVHELTAGHLHLIKTAKEYGDSVVVVLGCTKKPTPRDPLTYEMRRDMVQQHELVKLVLPHQDVPESNEEWSKNLDLLLKLVFPKAAVRLICSRDSFGPRYKGVHRITEITPQYTKETGTTSRNKVGTNPPVNNTMFRAGVIWAAMNYLPQEEWTDYGV